MVEKMSPLPVEVLVDFPYAIKKVIEGKSIHKLEWKDKKFYGKLEKGRLQLHKPDGKFYDWIISDGDLEGTDWVIL